MTAEASDFLRAELQRLDGGTLPAEVQTHISVLLLGTTRVWKLKKAVNLPYLDTRSPDRRLALCERELELNRNTAPALYRRVRRLVRRHDGSLQLDGDGTLVEPLVEMARFDESGVLDGMATRGELTPEIITRLAHVIAAFHDGAPAAKGLDRGGAQRVGDILGINEQALRAGKDLLGENPVESLIRATRDRWHRLGPVLDERQRAGQVRLCHGDLHLRNIVLLDAVPTLFDCLEFDADMATTDVLYDLAFVLMDLWHRDLQPLANLLFNRYLDENDQTGGLALMGLFLSMRAAIRAHVLATRAMEMDEPAGTQGGDSARGSVTAEACAYFQLAIRLLQSQPAHLIAIGGLSGSGKSTAAAAVAAAVGAPPGARVLSSDRVRKALFGVTPQTRLDSAAYLPAVSGRVYRQLQERAAVTVATGHSVIVDAVFDRPSERESIQDIAAAAQVPFLGVWLEAPAQVLIDRVDKRRGDASDADTRVVRRQLDRDLGTIGWARLPADDGQTSTRLQQLLQLPG